MTSVSIYPHVEAARGYDTVDKNPLPQLLQTPSGLAILELQGTINLPPRDDTDSTIHSQGETSIGKLIFPDYDSETQEEQGPAWMQRVYLYVGKHQRLTGEVKKLPKPLAVIRRRTPSPMETVVDHAEELEIVEIVKWKILFSNRPEPVGSLHGEG